MKRATFNTTMRNIAVNELKLAMERDQRAVEELDLWIKENPKHPDTPRIRQERKHLKIYIKSLRNCKQYIKQRLRTYFSF